MRGDGLISIEASPWNESLANCPRVLEGHVPPYLGTHGEVLHPSRNRKGDRRPVVKLWSFPDAITREKFRLTSTCRDKIWTFEWSCMHKDSWETENECVVPHLRIPWYYCVVACCYREFSSSWGQLIHVGSGTTGRLRSTTSSSKVCFWGKLLLHCSLGPAGEVITEDVICYFNVSF